MIKINIQRFFIKTSEKAHYEKYGDPKKCYEDYLNFTIKEGGRPTAEQYAEVLTGKFKTLPKRYHGIHINKVSSLSALFPFKKVKTILDLGSSGLSDTILFNYHPHIERIVCIDGDKKYMDAFKPYLDKRIEQIYCNFYEELVNLGEEKFDAILQIDFPEHLPDKLWEDVTKFYLKNLKVGGCIFLFTPLYPHNTDQPEHISVKSEGYLFKFFLNLNMKIVVIAKNAKALMVIQKTEETPI